MKKIFVLSVVCLVACAQLLPPSSFAQETKEFVSLFNGKDLSGWYGVKTLDPRKMSAMSSDELAAFQAKSEHAAAEHWTVDNGELVNDGGGPYLTTSQEFSDFELLIDYKTVAQADSGIYLKATPQVQIWDYTEEGGKWKHGAKKGSGSLWNNSKGKPGKFPLEFADKPFGQWNSVRIIQLGARTTVYLNDKLVVDHATMENFWDRKLPLVKNGPIQLQTHGGEIRWRNIKIREIAADEANEILASNNAEGFETVFNGKDFSGWSGPIDNYEIADGCLSCKKGGSGTIFTDAEYEDFQVRLEFNLPSAANNGLAIRYPGAGDTAYVGMCELQVLAADYPGKLDDRQVHGSAYGMVAATPGYLRETGQWNFQEVTVRGSKITVELNGSVILDCDLSDVSEYLADRPHPGKERTKGHFGFASHNDPVKFRNVMIKKLD